MEKAKGADIRALVQRKAAILITYKYVVHATLDTPDSPLTRDYDIRLSARSSCPLQDSRPETGIPGARVVAGKDTIALLRHSSSGPRVLLFPMVHVILTVVKVMVVLSSRRNVELCAICSR